MPRRTKSHADITAQLERIYGLSEDILAQSASKSRPEQVDIETDTESQLAFAKRVADTYRKNIEATASYKNGKRRSFRNMIQKGDTTGMHRVRARQYSSRTYRGVGGVG